MKLLILSLLFMATSQCTLMDETEKLDATIKKLEGVSSEQLCDLIVDDLCDTYPSLRTSDDKELATFKEELQNFMADFEGIESRLNETLSDYPSEYEISPVKLKELLKIATEAFEKLSGKEKLYIKTPSGLVLHIIKVQSLLRFIDSPKIAVAIEYNSKEKRMERWMKETMDYVTKERAEGREPGMMKIRIPADLAEEFEKYRKKSALEDKKKGIIDEDDEPAGPRNILEERDTYNMIELKSDFDGLNDQIVAYLCKQYPSLRPSSEKVMREFEKEYEQFIADVSEDEGVLDEVIAGFPSKYLIIPVKMKELAKHAKKEFKNLSEEEKQYAVDSTGYIRHKLLIQAPLRVLFANYKNKYLNEEDNGQNDDDEVDAVENQRNDHIEL